MIAVDVSASINHDERLLQRRGYVEALRHPDVVRAILAGRLKRIAVTYVEWSSTTHQTVLVPWREIDGEESAEAFAAALEAQPLRRGGSTSISAAIGFGAKLLLSNRIDGARQVIDVSGDQPNLRGSPVAVARDNAVARGIVINGLPVVVDRSAGSLDITQYYSDCVTGGPGSFVLPVTEVEEFAEAVRQKLIREIAGIPEAGIMRANAVAPSDCLAGERAIKRMRRSRPAILQMHDLDPWYELRD